tara:strand:- start:16652 stop:18826 length:2175 start_codon:yes stop_codon:yes gene_type:complete
MSEPSRKEWKMPSRFSAGASQVLGRTSYSILPAEGPGNESILASLRCLTSFLAINPPTARIPDSEADREEIVSQALQSMGIRGRQVSLQHDWHRSDSGPLLGFLKKDGRAVALIPTHGSSAYRIIDPVDETDLPVTDEIAAGLELSGWTVFRPLPEGPVTIWSLFKQGFRGQVRDILWIFFAALFAALLSLLTPIMTDVIVDTIVPTAQVQQLIYIGAAMVLAAVVTVLFNITSAIAILRIEGKAELSLQSAVWDRLLHLRMNFFEHYSAGDLARRVDGIDQMRNTVSETISKYILGAVFSLVNLILILFYSWKLAILAVVLCLVAMAVDVVVAVLQIKYQRIALNLGGQIANRIYEILNGITKWKASASEPVAMDWWSELFFPQQRANKAMGMIRSAGRAFDMAYPIVTSLFNYAIFYFFLSMTMTAGDFLGYNAAFTQMLIALLTASGATTAIVKLGPLLERLNPVLKAEEETLSQGQPADTLSGSIEVDNISFRYNPEEEDIFHKVSFKVNPGEMVAIVGGSGSGKSTLLKLLLGFETPTQGTIEYDGSNLDQLDISTVRQQLGVVLQHQNIFMGDIFTNIVGSRPLTEEQAMEAAEKAGIKDDIERLPMKMRTMISQSGGTFSGGQLQRIFIARALASEPRILLFDEATSALDNESQAIVSKNIESMNITRIVIAHRLSTIRNADRILVLHNKTISEEGTFEELMAQKGFFYELANRQIG